jgi:hypothetical protein
MLDYHLVASELAYNDNYLQEAARATGRRLALLRPARDIDCGLSEADLRRLNAPVASRRARSWGGESPLDARPALNTEAHTHQLANASALS